MEYSGTVITPSPGSSGDRPAQPPPCRKRHVDGISCEGHSSRTDILAGLDARGAAFRARVTERDLIVISHGRFTLKDKPLA